MSNSTAQSQSSTQLPYGLTPIPAKQSLSPPSTTKPNPVPISSLTVPTTALAKRIQAYARENLPRETYRHSLRVYSFGLAIARECYPDYKVETGSSLEETWFLTAVLHDIGTAKELLQIKGGTRLSFEFWGGIHALGLLQEGGGAEGGVAPREQAESVAEAIFRHQDLTDCGFISLVTRLIHLGTLLDNVGDGAEMVSPETIRAVNEEYPRDGWSGCFSKTVREEKRLKPYAMVSRIEGFEDMIEKNGSDGVMSEFEK